MCKRQIVAHNMFEQEVMTNFDSMAKMNEDLRVKIAGEINSNDNMTGYLSGALDDYLEDLMSRRQKLKE